nr:twin-arginine translocation pathway signal protein [Pseudomonadota bacterium]
PYNLEDPHFVVAAVSIAGEGNSGVLFQASKAEARHASELAFAAGRPQARWTDAAGAVTELSSPDRLPPDAVSVVCLTCAPGQQHLRVNSAVVASSTAQFAPSEFTQMLIGWGFLDYYPRPGFGGQVYRVIAGKGSPTAAELQILERVIAA